MATFLELCKKVAQDSNTIEPSQITTVVDQTGRPALIVKWVGDAWRALQNAHANWRWMSGEFEGSTIINQARYAGSDFNLTRFAEWTYTGESDEDRFSLYDPSIGVSDEGQILYLQWDEWYRRYTRGSQTAAKPNFFTVSPGNDLCLGPTPDAVYTVRGLYRKSPQELAADNDTPEMPTRFHDLIVDMALLRVGTHEESVQQFQLWQMRQFELFRQLERDQLPRVRLAGGASFA